MNENLIVSPCISICKSDPVSGYCYGCGRSDSDKAEWNNPDTSCLLYTSDAADD